MANFGMYGFPTTDTDPAATTSMTGDVRIDQAPPAAAAPSTPVALTAPRLGAAGGVAPLGGDGLVPSAYLPTPAGALSEASRWTRSGSNPLLSAAAAWEETAVYEPTVLYEAGTFKMWYTGGWPDGAIGYATSPDGISWTKYSGNPVIGQGGSGIAGLAARNSVLKVGAQYYCYYSDSAGAGTLHVATSTDGTSWTPRGVALAASAAAWSTGWANTHVWYDAAAGTWSMLVEGRTTGGSPIWEIGLATSPDGLLWTLDSHSPLTTLQRGTGSYGGPWLPAPQKIDGLYHLYYHAATSGDLPTDIYRATSPDLITWTQISAAILTHTGSGFEVDQVSDPSVLEAGGQSYLYYAGVDNPHSTAKIAVCTFGGPLAALIYGSGLPALLNGSGLLPASEGGTGVDASAASNGQLLIGNGSGFGLHTLTAGSGVTITNGSGTVTVAASAGGSTSPLTTKGDVWGYGSADARVPVGADGASLVADSTQTLGVRWGAPQPSSLLVLLPNPNAFVVVGTNNEQPPDFITLSSGDVIGVGGM